MEGSVCSGWPGGVRSGGRHQSPSAPPRGRGFSHLRVRVAVGALLSPRGERGPLVAESPPLRAASAGPPAEAGQGFDPLLPFQAPRKFV
jgi:hypothetical protein